ncbi:alpha-galactosidase [Labilibaculum filiforme]|uniref:Alpha-galactosidase n=1 Tax=Labilibaculum filiforme TaxID=1940526 RepID=A0A2N3HTK1_9BACT|nr:right-handed parallel beta-helix repeat-containing protein [Labilibaculum filiforme]PKQ61394.1 alpha-galactosidase [Labilibaculum filiforme]
MALVFVSCADSSSKNELLQFNTDIKEDATPDVLSKIMEAENLSEIRFEKGTYHFYPDKALEQFCYMSNHDDVLVRTAFPLKGMKNLTIDGQGASFIFHGRMIPFLVEDSQNLTIKNLTIDWDVPFHSEGLVVARNEQEGTFDLKIAKDYPYEIRNGQLLFIKEYYQHSIGEGILYDPARKAIAYNTEAYTPLTDWQESSANNGINEIHYKYEVDSRSPEQSHIGVENRIVAQQLKPGLVRIYHHSKKIPELGMIYACKGSHGENRIAPAFRVTGSKNFQAVNVTIHHAGGMGIIAENSEDVLLDNFNVTPSHGRMVSTTADATHFVGCRGKVTLRNCTFNNQLDDAMNVHGTYQKVVDILDDYTIGVRMGHFQQLGFTLATANDTIGLVRLSESFFPYEKLTVKKITKVNRRYQKITFNEKIPASIQAGDLVENLENYPEVLVDNCNISNNRARGLLISTPKKTVIKNSFFSTEMAAILVPVESGHWYESGSAADLTITNNKFDNCSYSGNNQAVISFVTDDDNANIAFKNIEISDNEFNTFDNLILEVANTDGLLFSGNTINSSNTFPKINPQNAAIHIRSSKNIVFDKNQYLGSAKEILRCDQPSKLKFK